MKRAAVFFDRDNTLIANDGYLGDPAGVVLVQGAADAVARVRGMGFAVITFSNQSGVARGMFTEEAVHAVNARLDELLQEEDAAAVIGRHEFCPFHPDGTVEKYSVDSDLRKPKPGMIFQAARRLDLDLSRSWVIGDAPRDIKAGNAAGCKTILCVDPRLSASPASEEPSTATPDYLVASLKAAVDIIVNEVLGPIEVTIPPATVAPVEPSVEPAAEAPIAAVDVVPQEMAASIPLDPPAVEIAPPAPLATPAPDTNVPPTDVAAKSPVKPNRSTPKVPFAQRLKGGAFDPSGKRTSGKGEIPKVANGEPSAAPATTQAVRSAIPVKATVATRARKPTFAERVRAGTFVPAGKEAPTLTIETIIEPAAVAEIAADSPAAIPSPASEEKSEPIAAMPMGETAVETSTVPPAEKIQEPPTTTDAPTTVAETIIESPPVLTTAPVEAMIETPSIAPTLFDERGTERSEISPTIVVETPAVVQSQTVVAPNPDAESSPVSSDAAPLAETIIDSSAIAPVSTVESPTEASTTIADVGSALADAPSDSAILGEHVRQGGPYEIPPSPQPSGSESVEAQIESPPAVSQSPVEASTNPPAITQSPVTQTKVEPAAASSAPPVESNMKTPPSESPQDSAAATDAPNPAGPAKKMTFAERVKAGTFQAERAAATTAVAAPDRPRRVMPMPGDRPQTQVNRVVESLTAVRPTQPVTPEEQLEPILQSILEELRLAREGDSESDFSLAKLIAGIVQVLVLPALYLAFMNRKVPGDLQSMLMLATFLETLVIALLIMGRS